MHAARVAAAVAIGIVIATPSAVAARDPSPVELQYTESLPGSTRAKPKSKSKPKAPAARGDRMPRHTAAAKTAKKPRRAAAAPTAKPKPVARPRAQAQLAWRPIRAAQPRIVERAAPVVAARDDGGGLTLALGIGGGAVAVAGAGAFAARRHLRR